MLTLSSLWDVGSLWLKYLCKSSPYPTVSKVSVHNEDKMHTWVLIVGNNLLSLVLNLLLISLCLLLSLQTVCFASGASETAHLAKVVARQRSSKKTGRPHLVNTQMRVKPAAPLVLNGKILDHHFGAFANINTTTQPFSLADLKNNCQFDKCIYYLSHGTSFKHSFACKALGWSL